MKLEYLMCIRDLAELRVTVDEIPLPGGRLGLLERIVRSRPLRTEIQRARLRTTNDVERSRRVLNLLYANWLAQVDKPARERAPLAAQLPVVIYAAEPSEPTAAGAISPPELEAAIRQTLFAQEYLHAVYWKSQGGAPWAGAGWEGKGVLAREPRPRAVLVLKLAGELFRRERGKPPAKAGELLGVCLKELPEGVRRDDPVPDTVE